MTKKIKTIDDLAPAPYNPRRIAPEAAAGLGASLERFGDLSGIVWNAQTGHLVAGHQRLAELRKRGAVLDGGAVVVEGERFAVRVVDWPLADEQAANLAANNPAIAGEFTDDVAGIIKAVQESDAALYEALRLGELEPELPKEVIDDEVPEQPKVPVTKLGDVWTLGRHRVVCGDCTIGAAVRTLVGDREVDILITSPPYNQGIDKFIPSGMHKEGRWVEKVGRLAYADSMPEDKYQAQQSEALANWFDVMRDGSSVFYNHKNRYRGKRVISPMAWLPGPFTLRQEIVWSRPGSVTQNARMFLPSDERIFWMYKGGDFFFDDTTENKTLPTVWAIGNEANPNHAVGFPVELPARCIRCCSKVGEMVLDPFLGSGTTLIAAEQLDRTCYGIEISPAYCDVIVERWEHLTGGKATRTGGV